VLLANGASKDADPKVKWVGNVLGKHQGALDLYISDPKEREAAGLSPKGDLGI
jgi:hypothetical protein